MHWNRRRTVILVVLSLVGVAAFGFAYRVMAGEIGATADAGKNDTFRQPPISSFAGY